ncbi:MAG: SET domain-containing protein-lysine N-methyltransferase [Promethearchaeota archaeon]
MNNSIKVKFISMKKGRGVFAEKNFAKGELIDVAHIILISKNDWNFIENTIISNYSFEWDDPKYRGTYDCAISFSISQFINHSYKPNAKYRYNHKDQTIEYIAIRNIAKGEELTVNYNGRPSDKTPVWFDVE